MSAAVAMEQDVAVKPKRRSGPKTRASVEYLALVDRAAIRAGMTQRATLAAVNAFVAELIAAVKVPGHLSIPKFGKFSTRLHEARRIVSPVIGGGHAIVPRHLGVVFTPRPFLKNPDITSVDDEETEQ